MSTAIYLLVAAVPIGLGFAARFWVSAVFRKADLVPAASGATGLQAARQLLAGGCPGVTVETVDGELTDHYDPRAHAVRLSEGVAESTSVAALAVVAHEVGHVIQDQTRDRTFRFQRTVVPVASFCSYGWIVAIGAGILLESAGFLVLAVMLFAGVAAFHLATLPVELGASRQALSLLAAEGLVTAGELPVARRVLRAAAFTYLVAALVAITELARIALEIALSAED
ncbi:MAG TPA: zinc metallopeptidase [Gaiellaceae bacterium]|nr:zinc metallopeptidase [Gaiellaceae bacterium]